MQRFHPDKFQNIDPRHNYTIEDATLTATYIEQAYRILASDEGLRDYLEFGTDAFCGKRWWYENNDGIAFEYSGASEFILNWKEAEQVAWRLMELDTPLNMPTPPRSSTPDSEQSPRSPDESERHSPIPTPEQQQQKQQADEEDMTSPPTPPNDSLDMTTDSTQTKKRRKSSKRESISSFKDKKVTKIFDHRKRNELKFQVTMAGSDAKIWLTSEEMRIYHTEELVTYMKEIKEKHPRRYTVLLRNDVELLEIIKN